MIKCSSVFIAVASLAIVLFSSLFSSPVTAQIPGLVHHYTFDDLEDGGNATDSVGGATGIWDGDAGANIAIGGYIAFGASQTNDEDGGNGQEHYTIGSLSGLDGAVGMTVSVWFNQNVDSNNNSTYNGLFMAREVTFNDGTGDITGQNWGVALEDNGPPRHIDWRINNAGATETDDIPGDAGWNHVVMTWDGVGDGTTGSRSLYYNGVELSTEAAPFGTITTAGTWDIGNDTCCGSREFTGSLDDIGVWNRPITSAEAFQLFTDGTNVINAAGVAGPLPGDVNLDGNVNVVDYQIITSNMLADVTTRGEGDLDGSGVVDYVDFAQWKNNASVAVLASVPEPSSSVLLLMACFAGLFGARRSRR